MDSDWNETDLGPALLLLAAVELDPDGPVVTEDTEVVPLVEVNPPARPHHACPSATVEPEDGILIYCSPANMCHKLRTFF